MKRTGTSTSAVETSPRWQAKQRRRRQAEERRWREQNGPVTITRRPPE